MTLFPQLSLFVLRKLLPFSSTYLCESGFSTMLNIKSKNRNRLDLEVDMRCSLSMTRPRIRNLVTLKQLHPSH